jgi:arsenite transporter
MSGPGLPWLERHQAPLLLASLAVGALVGLVAPAAAPALSSAVTPALGLVLYATFLGVPIRRVGSALRDVRFLATVLVVNFVVAPLVVFALSRIVAFDAALLAGVLLVLLTPCVDYVVLFTGLAGGAQDRLVAATPVLMVLQIVLLGPFLWLMAGPQLVASIDPAPFLEAFLLLVVLPLAAAALTQLAAERFRAARMLRDLGTGAMVPATMLTLVLVVASQIHGVWGELGRLAIVVPVFVAFAAIMTAAGAAAGAAAGRTGGLDVPARRAVVLSGVTRNSLVVLPLALALPAGQGLAPLVVVTQTLVELVVLVALIRIVPRLVRPPASPRV